MLFSSGLTNDTHVIFVSCNGLNEAKESLINSKLFKTLGVINLAEIEHWDKAKGKSKWTNAVFTNSEDPTTVSYFAFAFTTTNLHNILKFEFILLDDKVKLINFPAQEDKVPVFNLYDSNCKMMRVKRTTYAARAEDDEVAKLSQDIKQVIQHLQEEIKKQDKTVNEYEYAKLIQSFKRKYQAISADKNKLKDFFIKPEEEKQKPEQESLMKQNAKQIDLYKKVLAVQIRKQKQKKEKNIMIMKVTPATINEVLKMTFLKNKKRNL